MERQTITVDIAPGAYAEQRLRLSQGDIGRPLGVNITQGGVVLDCSDYSAILYVLKPDGNYYVGNCSINGNLIYWDTAEQETPLTGELQCQIRIVADGSDIGTARFVEYIEECPGDAGTPSETAIDSVRQLVDRTESAAQTCAESVETVEEIISAYGNPEVLVINCGTVSSLPKTVTNADIEDDMVAVNSVLGTPTAQTGDWTITTAAGSLTVSGTISGSTTLTLYLMKSR